jgi:hypothetical protein
MRIAAKRLLYEAYRRNDMADAHEASKPLRDRWLGLGTAAAYRPVLDEGLMVFHDGRTPPRGCMGWLVLTEEGERLFKLLSSEFEAALERLKRTTSYQNSVLSQFTLAGGITAK